MEYKIIATDEHVYGPINLETLRQWVKDQRVDANTWIYETVMDRWLKAAKVKEIAEMFTQAGEQPVAQPTPVPTGHSTLKPGVLKRLKVFADMNEEQLQTFVSLVEPVEVMVHKTIVKMGDQGDCMYLLLDGEVRVRQFVKGKETILATLETGDFFGEICLFDEGPRSADVIANKDCTVLKITKPAFHLIMDKHPDVGVRFLFAIIRTVEARIRNQNKRYTDSMSFGRSWSGSPALNSAMAAASASVRPPSRGFAT
jgi:CRP-like cAMP-binding protein